ncbi:hypothetical protein [Planctomycetes bacterium K23_9]
MVEVQPPPRRQQVAVGAPEIDSEAITEEAIAADATDDGDPIEVPRGFGGEVPDSTSEDLDSGVGPLPPAWQSSRSQRSRQIALVVALAGSGLIAAVLMFGWFVKNWSAESESTTETVAQETTVDSVNNAADPESTDQSPTDQQGTDLQNQDQLTGETVGVGETEPNPALPKPSDPSMGESATADPLAPVVPANQSSKPPESTITASGAPTGIPSDLIPSSMLDPLGLDARSKDTLSKDTSFPANPDKKETDQDGPIDLPAEARLFAGILNLEGGMDAPKLDAPATMDEIKIEGPINENIDPMMIANPPEPINFKRALAMKLFLAPTKNDEYPLSDLMMLLSQVSGVPIQIDWVSFDLTGIPIRDGVKGLKTAGWKSVGELLELTAASLNGEVIRSEALITLAPSDDAFKEKLAGLLDVSDFGPGQSTATATINAFLVGAGQPGANAKLIKVGDERHEQQVAALAVEAMRRMRGLKGKVSDQVLSRWAQSASNPRLDWEIVSGGNAGSPLVSPLTMAGLLRRISRENDSTCFVNWHDANRRGMAPQQLVMPFMGPNAGEVLKTTLKPYELHVRRVDDHHWWVGTEATYDRFPVIVWTEALGPSQDEFVRRIDQVSGTDEVKISIDDDSQKALLLLPRYIVRQMPKLIDGLK